MPNPEIEEFARLLVRHVRDTAVADSDAGFHPDAAAQLAVRWRANIGDPSGVKYATPDIVDQTVFCLLNAIDQGEIRLKFVASNGTETDLTEDGLGELAGWYMGTGGWRALYSQERFFDDFAHLVDPQE